MFRYIRWLLLFAVLAMHSSVWAIDPLFSIKLGEAEGKLGLIEKSLSNSDRRFELAVLKEFQEQGLEVRKIANECIDFSEKEINKSAEDLELLGAQAVTEDEEVTQKRQSLNQNMLSNAQELASCRLMLLRTNEMVDIALQRQQLKLANELLVKTDHVVLNIKRNLLNPGAVWSAAIDFIKTDSGLDTIRKNWILLLGLILMAVSVILFMKGWLKSHINQHANSDSKGYLSQFQLSLMTCGSHYLSPFLILAALNSFYLIQFVNTLELDFIGWLLFGLFLYVGMTLAIRIMLNPCPPAERLTQLPEQVSLLLSRRLRLLSKLLLVGFLMFIAINIHDFPEQITALLRNVYLFLLVINLSWVIWLLRYYEGVSNIHFLRVLIILGLLMCLVSDWMGYINLADFILIGIIGSILLWAFTIFIIRIWTDLFDGLDEGRSNWQKVIRKRIGVKEDEFLPGSIWFRFTFSLVLWSIFAVTLLKVWGLPEASLLLLTDTVTQGFEIGSVRVVPVKFVIALLMFALMLSVIGWIKRRMNKSWLKRSRMDRGSKESMISLTGYFGVAIAFLIALSIAGVQLANIALIAGALSVGIGFGLQNIVNNFLSGVILLFERPIKTGDWIEVGGTEGYVKKISIRSTQIMTFNRSDVIVPNSELISGQVTNLMLRDSIGRIEVPVGVAYGTDPEKVEEILIDIAYQQPEILTRSPVLPKPYVLFREFGDSSLNFELRCFVRDVDIRLSIISRINFAIEKAFKEANIEIPFPQRDVHLIPQNGGES